MAVNPLTPFSLFEPAASCPELSRSSGLFFSWMRSKDPVLGINQNTNRLSREIPVVTITTYNPSNSG